MQLLYHMWSVIDMYVIPIGMYVRCKNCDFVCTGDENIYIHESEHLCDRA